MRVQCRAGETDIVGEVDVGLFKVASVVVQAGKYQKRCFVKSCQKRNNRYSKIWPEDSC